MPYPDVEALLITWLTGDLPPDTATFTDELPYNLTYALPLIAVARFGGADTVLTLDRAHLDIDVFAGTRHAAKHLAEQVRESLRTRLQGATVDGTVVARVQTISAPTHTPWDDRQTRRVTAAYALTVHRAL